MPLGKPCRRCHITLWSLLESEEIISCLLSQVLPAVEVFITANKVGLSCPFVALLFPISATCLHFCCRVDGEPLRYHYLPSRGRRKLSTDCLDVPNNSTINYRNDFGALCNHLLRIHRVQRPLWAAIVSTFRYGPGV